MDPCMKNTVQRSSGGRREEPCVADAISEIADAFHQNALPDDDSCYTVKWMQRLKL